MHQLRCMHVMPDMLHHSFCNDKWSIRDMLREMTFLSCLFIHYTISYLNLALNLGIALLWLWPAGCLVRLHTFLFWI